MRSSGSPGANSPSGGRGPRLSDSSLASPVSPPFRQQFSDSQGGSSSRPPLSSVSDIDGVFTFNNVTEAKTPFMRQYKALREQLDGETIMFIRVGRFFELYEDQVAFGVNELGLKAAKHGNENFFAGVPDANALFYFRRSLAMGRRVAIVDELDQYSKTEKTQMRELVAVYTPGTVSDPQFSSTGERAGVVVLAQEGSTIDLNYFDPYSREIVHSRFEDSTETYTRLQSILLYLLPAEVLVRRDSHNFLYRFLRRSQEAQDYYLFDYLDFYDSLRYGSAKDFIEDHRDVGLVDEDSSVDLLAAPSPALKNLLHYLKYTMQIDPAHPMRLLCIEQYQKERCIQGALSTITQTTTRSLNVFSYVGMSTISTAVGGRDYSLFEILNLTLTTPGSRMLREWLLYPLVDLDTLRLRQDASVATSNCINGELRKDLARISDLQNIATFVKHHVDTVDSAEAASEALAAIRSGGAAGGDADEAGEAGEAGGFSQFRVKPECYSGGFGHATKVREVGMGAYKSARVAAGVVGATGATGAAARPGPDRSERAGKPAKPAKSARLARFGLLDDSDDDIGVPGQGDSCAAEADRAECPKKPEQPDQASLGGQAEHSSDKRLYVVSHSVSDRIFRAFVEGVFAIKKFHAGFSKAYEDSHHYGNEMLDSLLYGDAWQNFSELHTFIRKNIALDEAKGVMLAEDSEFQVDFDRDLRAAHKELLSALRGLARRYGLGEVQGLDSGNVRLTPYPDRLLVVSKAILGDSGLDLPQVSQTKALARFSLDDCDDIEPFLEREREVYAKSSDSLESAKRTMLEMIVNGIGSIRAVCNSISQIDVLYALGRLPKKYSRVEWCIPKLRDDLTIVSIQTGYHPHALKVSDSALSSWAPLNLTLQNEVLLLTGCNMSGKSTLMRTVGLLALMAQIGAPVPCSGMEVSPFHAFLARMTGADDSRSTFQMEADEVAELLKIVGEGRPQSDPLPSRSLLFLDEFGRGTDSRLGDSLAQSVIQFLRRYAGVTIASTHSVQLAINCQDTARAGSGESQDSLRAVGLGHLGYSITEGTLRFLHTFERGLCSRSFGTAVAELAGLPERVVRDAEAYSRGYLWEAYGEVLGEAEELLEGRE